MWKNEVAQTHKKSMRPASHHRSPTCASSLHNQHWHSQRPYPCPIMTSALALQKSRFLVGAGRQYMIQCGANVKQGCAACSLTNGDSSYPCMVTHDSTCSPRLSSAAHQSAAHQSTGKTATCLHKCKAQPSRYWTYTTGGRVTLMGPASLYKQCDSFRCGHRVRTEPHMRIHNAELSRPSPVCQAQDMHTAGKLFIVTMAPLVHVIPLVHRLNLPHHINTQL